MNLATSAPSAQPVSSLVSACRRQPGHVPPVWFMRQAGRSLPEYHRVRGDVPMLTACATPEMVAEITLQPVRRYGVDAAIIYSDIVAPLKWAGVDVDIVPGVGPVMGQPVRTMAEVKSLPPLEPEAVAPLAEAIQLVKPELDALGDKALIGFAGAPFTLASYLVEGGPSKNHERTKSMMYGDPQTWQALMAALADLSATFLVEQVKAGANVVQLFDSWVGAVDTVTYRKLVQPFSTKVVQQLREQVGDHIPLIHFGVGTGELLKDMAAVGADVVGVDFRLSLGEATNRLGPDVAVQGNLDPAVLFAPPQVVAAKTREVVTQGRKAPGHVFNLGHGVLPTTDPGQLQLVVDTIAEMGQSAADEEATPVS